MRNTPLPRAAAQVDGYLLRLDHWLDIHVARPLAHGLVSWHRWIDVDVTRPLAHRLVGWHQRRRARAAARRCARCRWGYVLSHPPLFPDEYNAHCRMCADNLLLSGLRQIVEECIDDRCDTECDKTSA